MNMISLGYISMLGDSGQYMSEPSPYEHVVIMVACINNRGMCCLLNYIKSSQTVSATCMISSHTCVKVSEGRVAYASVTKYCIERSKNTEMHLPFDPHSVFSASAY